MRKWTSLRFSGKTESVWTVHGKSPLALLPLHFSDLLSPSNLWNSTILCSLHSSFASLSSNFKVAVKFAMPGTCSCSVSGHVGPWKITTSSQLNRAARLDVLCRFSHVCRQIFRSISNIIHSFSQRDHVQVPCLGSTGNCPRFVSCHSWISEIIELNPGHPEMLEANGFVWFDCVLENVTLRFPP